MSKVYLVVHDFGYDGSHNKALFSSKKYAENYISFNYPDYKKRNAKYLGIIWDVKETDSDWIRIEEWEIDE